MNDMEQTKKSKNVFCNKNYTLVFLGALVSNIAALFYSFAVSFYILKLTDNNAFTQGLYLAVGGVVFCISSLFGGVISDRYDKAKIMYICDYIKGFIIIGFTLLFMFVIESNSYKVISLFIITIVLNGIAGVFSPASNAIIPEIVEEDSFQQAQSYFSILNSFQSIIGIFLAGILYTLIPIDVIFMIVGICYIGSAISEMFIKCNRSNEEKEKLSLKNVFIDIKSGFSYFVEVKPIFIIVMSVLVFNFFFSPLYSNFIPYFIVTDVAGTNYIFSEIMEPELWESVFSIGVGVGSLIMGIILSAMKQKEKYNKMIKIPFILISFLIGVFALCYLLFTKEIVSINFLLIFMLIAFVLVGSLSVMINVPSTTIMMILIDKDKFGKVSSVVNIGTQGLIPLSTFLAGIFITYFSSVGLLFICFAGVSIVSIILLFSKAIKDI